MADHDERGDGGRAARGFGRRGFLRVAGAGAAAGTLITAGLGDPARALADQKLAPLPTRRGTL